MKRLAPLGHSPIGLRGGQIRLGMMSCARLTEPSKFLGLDCVDKELADNIRCSAGIAS